jgi:hypothetical protein
MGRNAWIDSRYGNLQDSGYEYIVDVMPGSKIVWFLDPLMLHHLPMSPKYNPSKRDIHSYVNSAQAGLKLRAMHSLIAAYVANKYLSAPFRKVPSRHLHSLIISQMRQRPCQAVARPSCLLGNPASRWECLEWDHRLWCHPGWCFLSLRYLAWCHRC